MENFIPSAPSPAGFAAPASGLGSPAASRGRLRFRLRPVPADPDEQLRRAGRGAGEAAGARGGAGRRARMEGRWRRTTAGPPAARRRSPRRAWSPAVLFVAEPPVIAQAAPPDAERALPRKRPRPGLRGVPRPALRRCVCQGRRRRGRILAAAAAEPAAESIRFGNLVAEADPVRRRRPAASDCRRWPRTSRGRGKDVPADVPRLARRMPPSRAADASAVAGKSPADPVASRGGCRRRDAADASAVAAGRKSRRRSRNGPPPGRRNPPGRPDRRRPPERARAGASAAAAPTASRPSPREKGIGDLLPPSTGVGPNRRGAGRDEHGGLPRGAARTRTHRRPSPPPATRRRPVSAPRPAVPEPAAPSAEGRSRSGRTPSSSPGRATPPWKSRFPPPASGSSRSRSSSTRGSSTRTSPPRTRRAGKRSSGAFPRSSRRLPTRGWPSADSRYR